ncbi:helix-turn-helix transcriptional regulator [Nocardioides perillae]|uniref:DNA-binding NarL/FixJ family response regulator n=1 Tax=Nocardioides perillae TaxID=1119534 RepID=A0A7Y9RQG6_9ACTN|nr:LuxR C-terminal-related transcriptional regulator [Nocardioides perillae]NYG54651.1 DNA-binding NarL/FixJ family response regulator [Nocardioides perillae]
MTTSTLTLTLVDDCEVSIAGLQAVLAPFAERVEIVDPCQALRDPSGIDVILYEPVRQSDFSRSLLRDLQKRAEAVAVVWSWARPEELPVHTAGPCLPKSLPAARLVAALEALREGRPTPWAETPAPPPAPRAPRPRVADLLAASVERAEEVAAQEAEEEARRVAEDGGRPGGVRLTPREQQVLALLTRGLTNTEMADQLTLSVNSVKTYLRQAYRKIGASRRAQAVAWSLENGLAGLAATLTEVQATTPPAETGPARTAAPAPAAAAAVAPVSVPAVVARTPLAAGAVS